MDGPKQGSTACCFCGKLLQGAERYGNNPAPLAKEGRCCDECNFLKVIPARIEAYRRYRKYHEKQPLPTKQRMWIVCYLAKDNEGLIQGYRVKVVSSTLAGAAGIVENWLENKDHFITDIGIAADESSLGNGPEPDPAADSLDWPW